MDTQKVYECIEFNDINKIVSELSDKLEKKYLKLAVEKFRQRFARKVIVTSDPEVVAYYATDFKVLEPKEGETNLSLKVLSTVNISKAGCVNKANSTLFANMYENYNVSPSFSITVPILLTTGCREIKGSKIKHWNVMVIYIPDKEFLSQSLKASGDAAEVVSSLEPNTDNFRNYIRYKRLISIYNKINELSQGKLTKDELRSLVRVIKTDVLQNKINLKMNLLGTTSAGVIKERCTEGLTENVGKTGFRGKLTVIPVLGDVMPKKFKEFRDGEKIINSQVVREAAINLVYKTAFIVKSESANASESILDASYDVIIYDAGNFECEFNFKDDKQNN